MDNPPPPKWAIPQTLNGTIKKTKGHFFKHEGPGFEKQKRMLVFKVFYGSQLDKLALSSLGQRPGVTFNYLTLEAVVQPGRPRQTGHALHA